VPEGVSALATRLVFDDATAAIAFYQEAFGHIEDVDWDEIDRRMQALSEEQD
jgi:uncharacterized glyoxalase superfamily protein PhnB